MATCQAWKNNQFTLKKKKKRLLIKDTKPQRGNIGNAFWSLAAEPTFWGAPLFSVCVLTPALPLPSLAGKAYLPPSSLTTVNHPAPTRWREVRATLFSLDLHFYYANNPYSWKQIKWKVGGGSLATSSQIALWSWRGFMVQFNVTSTASRLSLSQLPFEHCFTL